MSYSAPSSGPPDPPDDASWVAFLGDGEPLSAPAPIRAIPVSARSVRAIPVEPPDEDFIRIAESMDDFDYSKPLRRRKRKPKRKPPKPNQLIPLFVGYGLMLGLLICMVGIVVVLLLASGPDIAAKAAEYENGATAAFEILCTALVGGVAYSIGRVRPHQTESHWQIAAWTFALPVLAVLLVGNIGFSTVVRDLFQVNHEPGPGLTLVTFLLVCLQPALVEEWFFRHLALGALREKVGMHGAVWISGAMFGIAHLLQPIAIPYLIVVGVCLGYMRVGSGGLTLPILMHGLHNGVVLVADKMM
jgi:uncharacterized protein